MPDVLELVNFFSKTFNADYRSYDGYADGYQTSGLDILLQRARRDKSVTENRIFDFIQVENDPNFGRKSSSNSSKFGGLLSKLGMSTSIMTIFNAQTYMAGLQEFIPANLRGLIQNFQTISDTSINLINNIQQQLTFKQIEQALLADLDIQFLGNTITFNEISLMADSIFENMPLMDAIKNNGLRALLSLGLQNFLPESMLGIFDSLQYLDILNDIFVEDEASMNAYTAEVETRIREYSETSVSESVTPERYEDVDLTFNDPLGIVLQEEFQNELIQTYTEQINIIINEVGAQYELTPQECTAIIEVVVPDAVDNVVSAFAGTVGLPSLPQVVSATNVQAYNYTVQAITNAFQTFTVKVIDRLGLNRPTADIKPLDYLANVKANIKKRIDMKKRGATTEAFVEIDAYLASVVKGGKITDEVLDDLNTKIEEILKERKELTF